MLLNEIKDAAKVSIEDIFKKLEDIFDEDGSDDMIKLKGLDFEDDVIKLHVETHSLGADFFLQISLVGDKIQIRGFEDELTVDTKGDVEDIAYRVLSSISQEAEDEEDRQLDDNDD